MTRPYSIAFKQKMINRLTGRDGVSANQLAKDTGIRQQNLSRWLREARNLPLMESNNQAVFTWTVEQKAQLLADASNLTGEELTAEIQKTLDGCGKSFEFDVVSNPEFLKEGAAISDFIKPDRIIVGTDNPRTTELLRSLYEPCNRNHDRFGADIENVRLGIGSDPRIGYIFI
jgi:transposase-like protein